MSEKNKGLFRKYSVIKLDNVNKEMDCIVLEFDDPIARKGIKAWAQAMTEAGYFKCSQEVLNKLKVFE